MSDTDTDPEVKETGGVSMGDLRDLIKEVVTEVLPGKNEGSEEPDKPTKRETHNQKADSISAEVEAALERVGKRKEAEAAEADYRAKVDGLLAEKPPVQRRRVHRLMGWGESE